MKEEIATDKSIIGALPLNREEMDYVLDALKSKRKFLGINFSHERSSELYKKTYPEKVRIDTLIWERIKELGDPLIETIEKLLRTIQ